jgi:hypothetical protein
MRTKDELLQKIDDDLIWRRRELSSFRAAIQDTGPLPGRRSSLLRAGVALLYAHWEGFVKRCGTYYLEFVANQGKKASELQVNFIAVKFKARLTEANKSNKPSASAELVEFFCTRLDDRLRIPHRGIIDAKSNLSSSVLREIVWILGLEMAPYETKCHLIDSSLLDRRNHIAHGDVLDIGLEDYLELHDEVMFLIDTFRTQLQNAAVTNAFMRRSGQGRA